MYANPAENITLQVVFNLRKIYKETEERVSLRWKFEEGIKRPYFHVKVSIGTAYQIEGTVCKPLSDWSIAATVSKAAPDWSVISSI